jgi:hypothetical protein
MQFLTTIGAMSWTKFCSARAGALESAHMATVMLATTLSACVMSIFIAFSS